MVPKISETERRAPFPVLAPTAQKIFRQGLKHEAPGDQILRLLLEGRFGHETRGVFRFGQAINHVLGMAGAVFAIPVIAAERTAAEEMNLALVADFCAAFAARDMTKIASYLASDCSYRN